jgi:four helix bundle protein
MQSPNNYNLEDRMAKFGEAVIEFCKAVSQDIISKPLISQLVRSGTSVGANYAEANGGSSKKDFRNKISICKKEVQETKHWIRMIVKCAPQKKIAAEILWKETHELTLIFQSIMNKLD